jgi:hypothetical protein
MVNPIYPVIFTPNIFDSRLMSVIHNNKSLSYRISYEEWSEVEGEIVSVYSD